MGETTLAVIDTKLDQILRRLNQINGKIEKHDERIRANEISLARLSVIAGGAGGAGGLIGAVIMALVK